VLRSWVVADLVDQVVEPGRDAKTAPVYGTGSDRLVDAGRGTLFMLREHLRTSVMGGRCDRPDAVACDYRLTYRSSQMVRTGAAKTKLCCEHMISATTTRELSTGLDEPAGKTHIAWTSDCNRRCRRFRPGGRSAQTHDAAGAERDGGVVDARSPPPGAATERAELLLEGNPYSPLPSRLVGGR
jgi:hypothetical protein